MKRAVRRTGVAAVTLAVVGGGYAAYATAAEPATAYRTAAVSVADVQETLALSGTLTPAGRADLAFGADGTVAAVPVTTGQTVEAGDVVARLDPRALRRAVADATSDVAAAKAQLESDEDAQAETVSSATSSSSTATSSGSNQPTQQQTQQPTQQSTQQPTEQETEEPTEQQPTSETPDVAAAMSTALAQLATQQDAVTTAQSASSAAIADAKQALTVQTTACAAAFDADPVADSESGDGSGDGSADTSATDPADAACTDALGKVQDAQDTVAGAQDTLQSALGTLADTLTGAVDTLATTVQSADATTGTTASTQQQSSQSSQSSQSGTTQQATQQQTQQATPAQPSSSSTEAASGASTSGASGTSDGMSQTVTAATLARDQAAIDEARAGLVAARAVLASATLTAPYAGTVVDVATEKGADTTAGTTVVTVIADGTTTVEIAATETQVRQLATGQAASIVPAGSDETMTGEVTAIGAVPDTSTGSTTYPVTVTLDGTDLGLPTGATASVAVVVGTAQDVLTVPSSAVSSGSVQVVEDGTATRTPVETGIVGSARTEITSGLEEGQEVSLADLSAALPSGDSETGSTTFGAGGGFGGSGGFGGGAGSGMPTRPGG